LYIAQDDFDDSEIATFSKNVVEKANEFKTLGEINIENEEKAKV
jgi:hypothetical protein